MTGVSGACQERTPPGAVEPFDQAFRDWVG